jgi:presenilin 1
MDTYRDDHSVLDDLGQEITGIASPVSLCMAITIFLVRLLHTQSDDDVRSVVIAEVIRETVRTPVG